MLVSIGKIGSGLNLLLKIPYIHMNLINLPMTAYLNFTSPVPALDKDTTPSQNKYPAMIWYPGVNQTVYFEFRKS